MAESDATHHALNPCGQAGGQHLPVELGCASQQLCCSCPVTAGWQSLAVVGTAAASASPAVGDTAVRRQPLPAVGSACLLQLLKWSCPGNSIICRTSQAAEQH